MLVVGGATHTNVEAITGGVEAHFGVEKGNALLVRALRSEEKVVGGIRHEGLVAHVGRHKASGSWSGSAVGVKALDEGSFG